MTLVLKIFMYINVNSADKNREQKVLSYRTTIIIITYLLVLAIIEIINHIIEEEMLEGIELSGRGRKKGSSMIGSKVINKGTGGNSKVNRPPQPHPKAAAKAMAAGDPNREEADPSHPDIPDELLRAFLSQPNKDQLIDKYLKDFYSGVILKYENENTDQILHHTQREKDLENKYVQKRNFSVGKHPNVCCIHPTSQSEGLVEVDVDGAPFCGLACLVVASGQVWEYEQYQAFVMTMANKGRELAFEWDDEEMAKLCGTTDFLGQAANEFGFNLRVVFNYPDVKLHPNQRLVYRNSPGFKWIILEYTMGETAAEPGHYTLLVGQRSNDNEVEVLMPSEANFQRVPHFLKLVFSGLLLTFILVLLQWWAWTFVVYVPLLLLVSVQYRYVIELKGEEYHPNNDDRRTVIDRRDKIKYHDSYQIMVGYYEIVLNLGLYSEKTILDYNSRRLLWLVQWFTNDHKRNYVVSKLRVRQVLFEAQNLIVAGSDPNMALTGLGRMREVNSDMATGYMLDTLDYCCYQIEAMQERTGTITRPRRALVAYSANNLDSYIGKLEEIAENQRNDQGDFIIGGAGRKLGEVTRAHKKHMSNHVIRHTLELFDERSVVAMAPLGCPVGDVGPVGPGIISKTDSVGLLTAFSGRSMTKHHVKPIIQEFIDFSLEFLNWFIENTEVPNISEPEVSQHFAKHYRGKKTARYIKDILASYENFITGKMKPKEMQKFQRHSAFVKFESNIKRDASNNTLPRPRLIMTMSDEMLVSCCPVTLVMDAWMDGPFKRFQVKHVSEEQVIEKVEEATSIEHTITDYSAFESSVSSVIRTLELYVTLAMCHRMGFNRTAREILRFSGPRVLSTKFGEFSIGTRCSGDFWTSFGNGIANVCVGAFSRFKTGKFEGPCSFRMIAEGDDGILETDGVNEAIINNLGFDFSSAVSGTRCGDCDFLRNLWVDGKRYLNVGRCFSVFWVKKGCELSERKQKFLLRCAGMSLHCLSPGHPVVAEVVNLIGRLTRNNKKKFKNYTRYLNMWKEVPDTSSYPANVVVDETMRAKVAEGSVDIPGLPVSSQLALEERLRKSTDCNVYVGNLLSDFKEIRDWMDSYSYVADRNGDIKHLGVFDLIDTLVNSNDEVEGFSLRGRNLKKESCCQTLGGQGLDRIINNDKIKKI